MKSDVVSSTEIRAVKILRDGTRVDLGLVSASYRNPLRRIYWRVIRKPLANRRIRKANTTSPKED